MPKLLPTSPLNILLMILVLSFNPLVFATEISVKQALDAAQAHTPGKVVAHELADEQVSPTGSAAGGELQPVYKIKILSQQGVMKTLFVHRHTGLVLE